MTVRELAAAVFRRWYVLLLVLVATAGLAVSLVRDGGLYFTRTVVLFVHLEAGQAAIGPDNGTANDNVIAFAGAVANDVNNGRPVTRYARVDAPLYGAGVTEGVHVSLPDDGGQWLTTYTRAEIDIEVVGRTREEVAARQAEALRKVFDVSRQLQGRAYDNPDDRIRAQVAPLSLTIEHISASRREQLLALVCLGLAGLLLGSWGAVRLDVRVRSRGGGRTRMSGTRSAPTGEP